MPPTRFDLKYSCAECLKWWTYFTRHAVLRWAPAGLIRTERASPAMAGRRWLATLWPRPSLRVFLVMRCKLHVSKRFFPRRRAPDGWFWQTCLKNARKRPGEWRMLATWMRYLRATYNYSMDWILNSIHTIAYAYNIAHITRNNSQFKSAVCIIFSMFYHLVLESFLSLFCSFRIIHIHLQCDLMMLDVSYFFTKFTYIIQFYSY